MSPAHSGIEEKRPMTGKMAPTTRKLRHSQAENASEIEQNIQRGMCALGKDGIQLIEGVETLQEYTGIGRCRRIQGTTADGEDGGRMGRCTVVRVRIGRSMTESVRYFARSKQAAALSQRQPKGKGPQLHSSTDIQQSSPCPSFKNTPIYILLHHFKRPPSSFTSTPSLLHTSNLHSPPVTPDVLCEAQHLWYLF